MRLFTDGTEVVLRCPHGIVRWQKKEKPTIEPVEPPPELTDLRRDGILAIAPDGANDFTEALEDCEPADATALDDSRVAAIIEQDGEAALAIGDPAADWDTVIELARLDGGKVNWPSGLIWAPEVDVASLFDDDSSALGPFPITEEGRPTITANRWGIGVASSATGMVAVFRPDQTAPAFTAQLPTQAEATLHIEPAKAGAIATLAIEGRESAAVKLDDSGALIAHRAAFGAPPAVVLDAGVLVYDNETDWLYFLDHNLEKRGRKRIGFWPAEATAAADGKSFAFASSSHLLLGTVTSAGKLKYIGTFAYADHISSRKRQAATKKAREHYEPKRLGGPPAIGFSHGFPAPAWNAHSGGKFKLELATRSTGSASKGVSVTISGDAVKHATFETLEGGGKKVAFEHQSDGSYTAALPDLDVPEGLVPNDPKPKNDSQKALAAELIQESHVHLVVKGTANQASSDLLSIIIGALDSDSPPMKWMRPFTIA